MTPVDTTYLDLRSRFVYGVAPAEVDWAASLPVRAWDRRTSTIGGQRVSAAGTPASYIVRRDQVLLLPLRFYETEWADVSALIEWGQSGETILWYPDANEAGTSFIVYLDNPAAGEDIVPTRAADYPRVLELTLALRSTSSDPWTLDYYYG